MSSRAGAFANAGGPAISKKNFDLDVAIIIGVIFGPLLLMRLWATKHLITAGPNSMGTSVAKVVKASTA